jgi:hypothetical protein
MASNGLAARRLPRSRPVTGRTALLAARPPGRPAVIELRSAFQPPVAASKVSVHAQLLEDMELGAEMQKKLIRRFEKKRARPSGQALSVWC